MLTESTGAAGSSSTKQLESVLEGAENRANAMALRQALGPRAWSAWTAGSYAGAEISGGGQDIGVSFTNIVAWGGLTTGEEKAKPFPR